MILLTGGTGFLGHYLVEELLKRDKTVRLLVRSREKASHWQGKVEIVEGDILDVVALDRAMKGVSQVIHAAAVVSFWKKKHDWMREVNVEGTANVVNAALEANVDKFLQVSSVAALGRPENRALPITSNLRWTKSKRNSEYGRTKYLAELEVYRGIAEGMKAVIVNPGIILGAPPHGDWKSGSPALFHKVDNGLKFYTPGQTAHVAATDVARVCLDLLESNLQNGERWILSAEDVKWKQFFTETAAELNKKAPSNCPPEWAAMLFARMANWWAGLTGNEPLITPETVRAGYGNYNYDGQPITEYLPNFQYRSIPEVIGEVATHYKEAKR